MNIGPSFDFRDLFVLDLANNHQGSVEHGTRIIREMAAVCRKHNVRAAIKFQFRQLDTFIHPDHRAQSSNKHVHRFLSTEMKREDFQKLYDVVREEGLLAMCTPFDEESVDVITEMGFDILKVASCSSKDWPLLEKIADAGLPVVFSTGGLSIHNIDDVTSFFDHRGVDYAMMYCVAIYPIPRDEFHLDQIDYMINRYPNTTIGWSTHEVPTDLVPVGLAVAKGARMFERHVGVVTDEIKLNAYSSTPEEVDRWIEAWSYAKALCGGPVPRPASTAEKESLDTLRRGVFARREIPAGATVSRDDIFFAMPYQEGGLDSGGWKDGIVTKTALKPNEALMVDQTIVPGNPDWMVIKSAIHDIKATLNEARIVLNSDFQAEFSHHYGIANFREFGATIINCINRDYCKKIIVMVPGQKHPPHFHKRKEETFQVLYGTLKVNIDGHIRTMHAGETALVQPGVWHSFWSDDGCVFEEISTTHYNDDSFYKDKAINKLQRSERKTMVNHWGRFELIDKAINTAQGAGGGNNAAPSAEHVMSHVAE
ncbi:N-acetylneuraminate synthase family protein [Niveispirillum irakense]|uniref:N-acetylneuraminate synthase family protein n=1 Tax=Niveispirillum irakense TaxID=34011 RepID=UPI00041F4332|nr:N-acetylneuraminate synthase family protein [Niveispirillum irakense]